MDPLFKEIVKVLTEHNTKVSPTTIKTYYYRLKWIKTNLGIESNNIINIISDYDNIIPFISESDIGLSTKKLLFVILNVLSKKLEIPEDIQRAYNNKMNEFRDLANRRRGENKISEKDINNWASWDDVCEVYKRIPDDSFRNIQDKLIIGLYVNLEGWVLRLDFANVKIYKKDMNKLDHNWLHWDKMNNRFILHIVEYKTSKNYGQLDIEIVDEGLKELLNKWFTEYNKNPIYLLVNYRDLDKGLSKSALSHKIKKIFKKYSGKAINNQLLRQIKETNNIYDNADKYNKMTLNEKIDIHKKLLHSFETAHGYLKIKRD